MSRRVIFLVALLIVAGGAILALVLSQQSNNRPVVVVTSEGGTIVAQDPSGTPQATVTPFPTPLPTIDIVVAVQKINRGQIIQANDIGYATWPESFAPLSAILDAELVIGSIARFDIERESPIKTSDITDNLADISPFGSDAGAILPPGTRMVAVPIDRITSVAYALQPGDRVDMIVSLLYVGIDEEFQSRLPNGIRLISVESDENGGLSLNIEEAVPGRTDSIPVALGMLGVVNLPVIIAPVEDQRPRLATQMTIQDALVINVGDFPRNGRLFTRASSAAAPVADVTAEPTPQGQAAATPTPLPPRPDIVAIAVSPQEAVVLSYFIEARVPITFALRPANETGIASVRQVDLDYIMEQYRIQLPRTLPYGIEPAIRTIRQLVAGDTISLVPTAVPAAPATR